MGLASFKRIKRLHKVEEMKPENIQPEVVVTPVIQEEVKVQNEDKVDEVVNELVEEVKEETTTRRRKRK